MHDTAADALTSLDEKEEMTKARQQTTVLKNSLCHVITYSIEHGNTKDTTSELKRLSELKPQRQLERI